VDLLLTLGLAAIAALALVYLGRAIIIRKRAAVRMASVSRGIVHATVTAKSDAVRPSPTDGAQLLQSAQVEDPALGLLAKLPPFAPVAIRLLRLLDRADTEPREIASQIAADPALRAQLLGIANSPLFAIRVPVEDPLKAITMIGMEQTRALAITWTMRSLHANAPKSGLVRRLWRHSLTTGIVAEWLADAYGLSAAYANSAGTLHDIGRIGLLAAHRDAYEKLLLQTYDSTEQMLLEEKLQFGLNHCEAGGVLIRSWGFAEGLWPAATDHHQPFHGAGLTSLIQLACHLSTSLGFPAVTYPVVHSPDVIVSQKVPVELQSTIQQRLPSLRDHLDQSVKKLDF
jgi:HD-like signal output (HDOD) protein